MNAPASAEIQGGARRGASSRSIKVPTEAEMRRRANKVILYKRHVYGRPAPWGIRTWGGRVVKLVGGGKPAARQIQYEAYYAEFYGNNGTTNDGAHTDGTNNEGADNNIANNQGAGSGIANNSNEAQSEIDVRGVDRIAPQEVGEAPPQEAGEAPGQAGS